jgi:maltodextrin utilization protein YvdJ
MLGKKILAVIFAAVILIKLAFLLISPSLWQGATQAFLGHYGAMIGIYLMLLIITGYFVFTSLDLIDVAVVMLFTSLLLGLSLLPYLASMPQFREAMVTMRFGKAWPALILWAAIAVAVLYRIFAGKKEK